jgi:hypothetical protein
MKSAAGKPGFLIDSAVAALFLPVPSLHASFDVLVTLLLTGMEAE